MAIWKLHIISKTVSTLSHLYNFINNMEYPTNYIEIPDTNEEIVRSKVSLISNSHSKLQPLEWIVLSIAAVYIASA